MQKYDPAKHHRRSIRLPGHDYSAAGAYFVTICVNYRHRLLGEVRQGVMVPNAAGKMVQQVWQELPLHYAGVGIDAFAVMPDHYSWRDCFAALWWLSIRRGDASLQVIYHSEVSAWGKSRKLAKI